MTESAPNTPAETGIARYIRGYPDNEAVKARFVELSNLLQPVYGDGNFDHQRNFNGVFEKACVLIDTMISEFGVLNRDEDFFRKFKSDIIMCGLYASEALDIVLLRLAKIRHETVNPN